MGIYIKGMGAYVPEKNITNDDFAKIMETSDEWIASRTGIKTRQYASGTPVWKMAEAAAKRALASVSNSAIERAGTPDIDLIITSTITADFFTPSVSCLVAGSLGLCCPAFDIGAACSGFVYALDAAERYLRTDDNMKNVLVISSEMLSRYTDFHDRSSAIIFGDGAAAAVVSKSADDSIYGSFLGSDGTGGKHLYGKLPFPKYPFYDYEITDMDEYPGGDNVIVQNGKEVYKFAVKAMPMAIETALERAKIKTADVTWFIPHQANKRIIETAAKAMEIPLEKFIMNIETRGNTSSASIPIAFYEAEKAGKIKRGDIICICGFGAGLTYGALIFEY
jgi:3-oxoacyl-[acyl-carrier-protein] synthase-3